MMMRMKPEAAALAMTPMWFSASRKDAWIDGKEPLSTAGYLRIREQQQSRVLDPARAEHVIASVKADRRALETAGFEVIDLGVDNIITGCGIRGCPGPAAAAPAASRRRAGP